MLSALRSDTVASANQPPVAIGQQMPVVSLTMPATAQTYVDFAAGEHGRLRHFDAASNLPVVKEELTTASPDHPIPAGHEFSLFPTLPNNLEHFWELTYDDQMRKVQGTKREVDVEKAKRYANDGKSRVKCAIRCRIHQIEEKGERMPPTEEALFHSTTDVMFKNAMVDCDYQRVANIGTHMKDYRKMLSDIQQARATIKAERKSRLK